MNLLISFIKHPLVTLVGAMIGGLMTIPFLVIIDFLLRGLLGIHIRMEALANNGFTALPFILGGATGYVQFYVKNGWGITWFFKKITVPLTQPGAKILFLFAFGSFLLTVRQIAVNPSEYGSFIENIMQSAFQGRYLWMNTYRWFALTGLAGTILAGTIAYTYEKTVGSIRRWIFET